MKQNFLRRALSLLLVVCLVAGILPGASLAAEADSFGPPFYVSNESELQAALQEIADHSSEWPTADKVVLEITADFTLTQTATIQTDRYLSILGNNHTITAGSGLKGSTMLYVARTMTTGDGIIASNLILDGADQARLLSLESTRQGDGSFVLTLS